MGKGSGEGSGPGLSRDAVCPCRLGCTAPEGRPPSFLVRAFLLGAARRVGRRSGNAIGDGGWAPDRAWGQAAGRAHPAEEPGNGAHPEERPGHSCWLCCAGTRLAWQLVVTKAWLGFHGLGLVLVFRLETARLGRAQVTPARPRHKANSSHICCCFL